MHPVCLFVLPMSAHTWSTVSNWVTDFVPSVWLLGGEVTVHQILGDLIGFCVLPSGLADRAAQPSALHQHLDHTVPDNDAAAQS